jgi:flavin reductase (DIM6/NTAB) family NADH-FMN oxidoreductase RutF
MEFDFVALDAQSRYKLLGATVTPRPIAWVSTLDANGLLNAAPFSFFNAFGEDPPTLGFAIQHRSETDFKDTGANIRLRKEFVVNLVSEENLEQMNVSAIEFPPRIDEFREAGITTAPSSRITTPRIAESRVSFECKLDQIIALGNRRSLVLGEVVMMHVRDDSVIDAAKCYIDTPSLKLVGRMHNNTYVKTSDLVFLPRISESEWNSRLLEQPQ